MIDRMVEILAYNPDEPMMVNSGLFWVLFIIFLPFYAMLRHRKRTVMVMYVVLFSLYFYYKASGLFCLLLLSRALIDFYLVKMMAKKEHGNYRKILFAISLILSLGLLVYFKYSDFIVFNWDMLLGLNFQPMDMIMPIGLSFYTFQSASYIIDVYRKRTLPARSVLDYLFYLSFFPTVVAGPIVRAGEFLPQIYQRKKITEKKVFGGFFLIMVGLVKKAIVADYLSTYNNLVFSMPESFNGFECLMGVLGFSVQIYCDFSGYSDIAIGLGSILGFDLGKNFESPYRATNISDFWRRWHISLSSWLRDYVYIPLGGNQKGVTRMCFNIMVTMAIGGIWHGAGWNFLIWGSLHGFGIVIDKIKVLHWDRSSGNVFLKMVAWFSTFLFVSALWIFFRMDSLSGSLLVFEKIFLQFNTDFIGAFLNNRLILVVVLLVSLVAMLIPRRFYSTLERAYLKMGWVIKLILFVILVQIILEFSNSQVAPFIYSQF